MIIYHYYCPGSPHQTYNLRCVLHDGPGLLGPGQMFLCSLHSILTLTSPQPCPMPLPPQSTLISPDKDSTSLCSTLCLTTSVPPERAFRLWKVDLGKLTSTRRWNANPRVLCHPKPPRPTSRVLNDKLLCSDVSLCQHTTHPMHGGWMPLGKAWQVMAGRREGSASHPLSILGSMFLENASSKKEGVW